MERLCSIRLDRLAPKRRDISNNKLNLLLNTHSVRLDKKEPTFFNKLFIK
jgi:hypothetical protein